MHADPDQIPEELPVPPGEDTDDEPTPSLPADPDPGAPERNPAVNSAEAANDPDPKHQPKKEEPEIGNEGNIPSDGPDPEDETLIDEVDKPSEPAGKPERE